MPAPILNSEFSCAEIIYRWGCASCDAVHVESHHLYRGNPVVLASLPEGWSELADQFYCPAHHLVLFVDGKQQVLAVGLRK